MEDDPLFQPLGRATLPCKASPLSFRVNSAFWLYAWKVYTFCLSLAYCLVATAGHASGAQLCRSRLEAGGSGMTFFLCYFLSTTKQLQIELTQDLFHKKAGRTYGSSCEV